MSFSCQDAAVISRPRVCIVSPAVAAANNGNWHTADRWRAYLSPCADVELAQGWEGQACDLLIALHARKSAEAIARFRATHAHSPIVLVLTGTDLYRDIAVDAAAQRSLALADRIVVLQPRALAALDTALHHKSCVILQSAPQADRVEPLAGVREFVAVGHLRGEKDPLTLMQAARLLPPSTPIRITHIGDALDEALARHARNTMSACGRYRWIGSLPHQAARRSISRSRALIHMSRMEGGANVVIEAIRSGVPVLASDIDGNKGLLGDAYGGYFPVGDAEALAALLLRFISDESFAAKLTAQCRSLEPVFAPEQEANAVRELVAGLC